MTLQSLFAALHREGHADSPEPPHLDMADIASPWYTRVLMGFMGWLGGLFVLGFLGALLSGLFSKSAGMTVVAIAMFAGSFGIYRMARGNDFATQFALAASICAQAAAAVAFANAIGHSVDNRSTAWFVAVMQIALVFAMPNVLHRLISTMFAVLAMFLAAEKGLMVPLLDALLSVTLVMLGRNESALVAGGRRLLAEPVINGVAFALLLRGAAHVNFLGSTPWLPFTLYSAIAFAVVLVLWVVLNTGRVAIVPRSAAVLAAMVYGAVTWQAPGLIASALVLLVAFGSGRRALTGCALLALAAYLSTFYYQMHMTLAAKALVLALSGASLLVMWWVHRTFFAREAA